MVKRQIILAGILIIVMALALACAGCAPSGDAELPDRQAQTQYIYDLFQGADTSAEDQEKIILALKDIDWHVYEQISGGRSMELIEWLYSLEISDEAQISSLLQGTTCLDGAYSEGYSSVLANIFIADQEKFLDLLSQLDAAQVTAALKLTAYGSAGTAYEQIKADLTALIDSGKLEAAAQDAAEELKSIFKEYYN